MLCLREHSFATGTFDIEAEYTTGSNILPRPLSNMADKLLEGDIKLYLTLGLRMRGGGGGGGGGTPVHGETTISETCTASRSRP